MWNSLYDVPANQGQDISDKILDVLRPKFDKFFISYHTPVATFMSKNSSSDSNCALHRDYSTQDEENFQYRNVWIPLVSTKKNNGALYVLKGSNIVFDYVLPMFTEWPYKSMQEQLKQMSQVIEADAGDMVIYLDKTLHGSLVNFSEDSRPVVHLGALHPENILCFYYHDRHTERVRVYEVPFNFFFEKDFSDPGKKYPLVREFQFNPPALDIAAVRERLSKHLSLNDED
jgi:hypothetical protein